MAQGDKKPVIMEADIGVEGGVPPYLHASQHSASGTDPITPHMIGAKSNENLLINRYFADPIDQRGGWLSVKGNTAYTDTALTTFAFTQEADDYCPVTYANETYCIMTLSGKPYYIKTSDCVRGYVGNGYTIDRAFANNDPVVLITEEGLKLISTGPYGTLAWFLDHEFAEDTEVTVSALYKGSARLDRWGINGDDILSDGWDVATFTYTIPAGTNLANRYFSPSFKAVGNGGVAWLKAIKLELGSTQTLAHQDENGNWVLNDPPPDKALELAKCQRYYVKLDGSFGMIMTGVNRGGIKAAIFDIPVPVTMRVTPEITDVETYGECLVNGTWYPVTDMNTDVAHAGSVRVFWGNNGISDVAPCVIDGAKFAFSAEL